MIGALYISTFYIHYVRFDTDQEFIRKIDIVHCPLEEMLIIFGTIFASFRQILVHHFIA